MPRACKGPCVRLGHLPALQAELPGDVGPLALPAPAPVECLPGPLFSPGWPACSLEARLPGAPLGPSAVSEVLWGRAQSRGTRSTRDLRGSRSQTAVTALTRTHQVAPGLGAGTQPGLGGASRVQGLACLPNTSRARARPVPRGPQRFWCADRQTDRQAGALPSTPKSSPAGKAQQAPGLGRRAAWGPHPLHTQPSATGRGL